MTTPKIFKELKLYLNGHQLNTLKLSYSLKPDVQICLTVSKIVMGYHGRQEDEDRVCELLTNLCKNHFNKKK